VRRPVSALVCGGLTPQLSNELNFAEGCDRSQPIKAVTGHPIPKLRLTPRHIFVNIRYIFDVKRK
jgi:hypothetical protein